jgi:hypothetical protein
MGEYYASLLIPLDANLGDYRIRWTFREYVGAPVQQVLQEFAVADKNIALPNSTLYTEIETGALRSLRILLRDNCIGEEETVELDADGERSIVSIKELWEILHVSPENSSP